MFDVTIIGAGVVGSAIAYELSKKELSVLLLEKENDVSTGTTKANSAIVHAGYDPETGTLMAKLNVEGSRLLKEQCARLSVMYKQVGSFVIALTNEDMGTLDKLYKRGVENGVEGLKILTGSEALALEPNLNNKLLGALYAPSAAVIDPWGLCIAYAEVAVKNGVCLKLSTAVSAIKKQDDGFQITANGGEYRSRFVINCAGVHSAEINDMVAPSEFSITPSKGQYYLLDKSQGGLVKRIIFQCPSKIGKGVLVAPTVGGNLIVGPNSSDGKSLDDVSTDGDGLEFVRTMSGVSVSGINFRETIRNFSGERAIAEGKDDFLIYNSTHADGFINVAGIKSPGLTAAPAIALYVLGILEGCGLSLTEKENYCNSREAIAFSALSYEEKAALIEKDSSFGRVICRCETITEGEILAALRSPIPPRTIDGIKRRCGAGMGRCQGGFCSPRVQEIIARELKIPMEEVLLDKSGTIIITGKTKDGERC